MRVLYISRVDEVLSLPPLDRGTHWIWPDCHQSHMSYAAQCTLFIGTSTGGSTAAGGGSTSGVAVVSPLRSPRPERLRSTVGEDAAQKPHSKQSLTMNQSPLKHHSTGDQLVRLKLRTRTPKKTPVADRYAVFFRVGRHLFTVQKSFSTLMLSVQYLVPRGLNC